MNTMRGQDGIQALLTAEQEAQQIVSTAKNNKLTRLKQAKDEAELEVVAFRTSLEKENQRKNLEASGSSGWHVKKLEEETETKISGLKDASTIVGSDVVSILLNHVTSVRV